MIPIHIDRENVTVDTVGMRDLGALFEALAEKWRGRVVVSTVLNGWERVDPEDAGARGIPLDLVSDLWIETESVDDAAERVLRSACALAIHAATTATRAGEAFESGHDSEGYLGFAALCSFTDDLSSAATVLDAHGAKHAGFEHFLDAWRGRCVPALTALVESGEAKDHTLMADHLLYDLAPAFEALGASGCPA